MHFVYILHSNKHDKYYVGQTDDIKRRLLEHNELSEKSFTSRYRPWKLALTLEVADRSMAIRMERYIKKQKSKKYIRELIASKDRQLLLMQRLTDDEIL